MKLLIITQKVDRLDPILGFFHEWIKAFALRAERITVLCLEEGEHVLPENVSVHSLGKKNGSSRLSILKNLYSSILKKRSEYDKVFIHMNPIYIVVAGLFWKFLKKDVFLWYTHKSVDGKLRVAEMLADKVFTATKESFRLSSRKIIVTGHGIDTDLFVPVLPKVELQVRTLVSSGRIAVSKNYAVLVETMRILKEKNVLAKLFLIGCPVLPEDVAYQEGLKKIIREKNLEQEITFVGPVSNKESVAYFQSAHVFLHSSETGSLDKVVLEAMACGVPVISSNDAAAPILSRIDTHLVFRKDDARDLSEKIIFLLEEKGDLPALRQRLREEVVVHHNLLRLIEKLLRIMDKPHGTHV